MYTFQGYQIVWFINPLNAELNPICHLLALLGAHYIFHVSGLRVNDQQIHEWPSAKQTNKSGMVTEKM